MTEDCPRCKQHTVLLKRGVCRACFNQLEAKRIREETGMSRIMHGSNSPHVIKRKQAERKLARTEGPEPKRAKPSLPRVKWLEREMP